MPSLTIPIQYSTGSSSQSNQARKRKKVIQVGKEEAKLSLTAETISRRSHHLSPKSPETDKQLQQRLRIQNQCVEITSISIHQ